MKNYKEFLKLNESPFIMGGIKTEMLEYNPMIDYTLLDNNASDEEIIQLCEKARIFNVKSVCVMPKHVELAAKELSDCGILVCTVISFPEGTNKLESKKTETYKVIQDGADEVDMVLDYQKLKASWDNEIDDIPRDQEFYAAEEVSALANICHEAKNKKGEIVILKVIVESGLLTEKQTETATWACLQGGADFIKTSTGKVNVGAELNKIKIMYDTIKANGADMKIKASGGVRDMNDINKYMSYVDRFGMGWQSVDTLNGLESNGTGY